MKHVIDPSQKTLTLVIPSDIVSTNAETLRQEIYSVLENADVRQATWVTLKLDLTAAVMIDSVGLNLLVSIIRTAKARNAKTSAVIASKSVQRALAFTRLDTHMQVQMAA